MDDRRLIEEAIEGSEEHFETLLRRYTPAVAGFLSARGVSNADREDLLQEVFIVAFRKLDTLRNRDRFGPWLIAIARNLLRKHIRTLSRSFQPMSAADAFGHVAVHESTPDPGPDPAAAASLEEVVRMVSDGIGKLNDRHRSAVYLFLIEQTSPKEIAAVLGLRESAAKMRIKRGLEMLRKSLLTKGFSPDAIARLQDGRPTCRKP